MIQKTLVVGPLQCNCMILGCESTKEAVIIDPGDEAPRILSEVTAAGFKVKYLLHTHAHFDHVGATGDLKKKIEAKICLHKDDDMLYRALPMQGKMFGMVFPEPPPVEKYLENEEVLHFGTHKLEVLHTPGHSPGGVCFRTDEILFSGDTLFQQSIGRTDLWGGDYGTLIRSIKSRLFALDDDTKVFPGHGPATQIGVEKRSNPFLI